MDAAILALLGVVAALLGALLFRAQPIARKRPRTTTEPPPDNPDLHDLRRQVTALRLEMEEVIDRVQRWQKRDASRERRDGSAEPTIPQPSTAASTVFPQPQTGRKAAKSALRAAMMGRR